MIYPARPLIAVKFVVAIGIIVTPAFMPSSAGEATAADAWTFGRPLGLNSTEDDSPPAAKYCPSSQFDPSLPA